jgi:TetR/AcrR family transcriptional regulator, tetracycline repressor protein
MAGGRDSGGADRGGAGAGPDAGEIPDGPGEAVAPPPWRSPPRRRGAPRPQLSRDAIVAAALKVIGTDGGAALTMRRVADQIGVSASALYGYVANKEELVQLVLEQIIGEIQVPEAAAGTWQDTMRDFAREMLGMFRRHPGVAGLTLGRVPFGPSLLAGAEFMVGTLRSAGLPDQVAAFAGDLGALYVGAYAYEQEIAPASGQEEMAAQAGAWLASLPAGQFPNLVAVAAKMVAGSGDDRFEWGLDVIVRGLGTYLTSPPAAEARWPQG